MNFLGSRWGEEVLIYADWDHGWITELFQSVDSLRESVRPEVTRETVTMLQALAAM